MDDFKVGDKVTWFNYDTGISYNGILQDGLDRANIWFGKESAFYKEYKYIDYQFSNWDHVTLQLSNEEKLSRKIKLLWNQSNWVKKNPSQMIIT